MRSYVAVSLFAFSASVLSAPTPQIANIVGSGNNNGNGNSLIGGNSLLSANKVNVDVDGLTDGLLHEKRQVDDVVGGLTRPASNTLEDVTKVRVLGNARRQLTVPLVPGALKTVDTITDSVNLNGAASGLNTHVNSKRQLNAPGVGFATAKLDQVTDSLNTKGAVEGLDTDVHNKRQLTPPVVPGALSAVDSVTGKLNLNGAVTGLNTNVNSKRQLNAPGVGFATAKLDQVTDSLNTKGAVEGLDTDVHNKRQLLDLSGLNGVADAAGLITKPLDSITNAIPGPENKKAKRDIPLVSDLPVVGGLTDPVNHLPVVGELTNTLDQAVPDLSGVESTLYDAAKPVTDATNVLDVKRHEQAGVVDGTVGTAGGAVDTASGVVGTADGVVGGVTGTANGAVGTVKGLAGLNGEKVENEVESGNNNGNNNSLIGGNSLLSGNSINL